jgi:hypothetical protein
MSDDGDRPGCAAVVALIAWALFLTCCALGYAVASALL